MPALIYEASARLEHIRLFSLEEALYVSATIYRRVV